MGPERKVVLRSEHAPGDSRYLEAAITADGDLVVSGQDLGDTVEEIWGETLREYEWAMTVRAADVPRAADAIGGEPGSDILELLRARGPGISDSELRRIWETAGIEVGWWSRIGD